MSLSDVAGRAGVSVSVASRALSGDPAARLSEATRRRVRQAADELAYRPNHAGRSLRRARTDVIALIVPDVTNALFAELTRGADAEAAARGLTVLLGRGDETATGLVLAERLLAEGRVDGVILQPRDGADPQELAPLARAGAPVVIVHDEIAGASAVLLDDAAAAMAAVDHLVAHGRQRLALIGGIEASSSARRREAGFRSALAAHGMPVNEQWITRLGYGPEDGRAAMGQLLKSDERPDAVVVANVNAGFGALAEAARLGVAVPESVALVAIHDSWPAAYSSPALTCVRTPLYELGRAAVAGLSDRIAGGGPQVVRVSVPAPVVVARASTAS
ncbi:LacI family DNA-binding transcriptional regulator [Agromyces albus]|uniref:LacI family DNA-binding transcriptional regulator n=1 Tax=Agromyces albus TaxID=205332 RepID=UPI0027D77CDF|nr:LacI family DNA-binding transcriptional regulator [Agromyces albus]